MTVPTSSREVSLNVADRIGMLMDLLGVKLAPLTLPYPALLQDKTKSKGLDKSHRRILWFVLTQWSLSIR